MVTDRRYERGLEVYASQFQIPPEAVASWFAERVGERFGEEAIRSAAGAWVDDELSLRDRSLIVVAALITQGGAEQQLRVHTRWAIHHGCTRQQLEALATLLGVYVGYPRDGQPLSQGDWLSRTGAVSALGEQTRSIPRVPDRAMGGR